MTRLLTNLLSASLCLAATAQEAPSTKLRLRAVLHDPLHPQAELYVPSDSGSLVPLNLSLEGLTEAQTVAVKKGSLQLFSKATLDPNEPLAGLAATVSVPPEVKRAIVFILPSSEASKAPYRMLILNDAARVFPKAETRVLNMTPLSLAMKAGEHSVKLPPAKITAVPKVTKVNHMNQAQTEFYLKGEGKNGWHLVAERPMQFSNNARNIILIYQMPNNTTPQLRTLVDTDLR
jgi:hypothetical protein